MQPTGNELNGLAALYSNGDYAALETEAGRLLKAYPDVGFLWQVLGVALNSQGKDGLVALQKAVALLPRDAQAHSNLGNALKAAGRLSEAEASYRHALMLNADDVVARYNLGTVLQLGGRKAEAEAAYRAAISNQPDFSEAIYNLAVLLDEGESFVEAEACYRRVVEIQPLHADAYNNLGLLLNRMKRLDEAEAACRKAAAIRPGNPEFILRVGFLQMRAGRFVDAETSFCQAIALRPDFDEAFYGLGFVQKEQGYLELAEESIRRALSLNKAHAPSYIALAIILQRRGRLSEAEAACLAALRIDPQLAEVHNDLGLIYMVGGRIDSAVHSFQRALELQPDYPAAFSNLLLAYNYNAQKPASYCLEEARRYGRLVEAKALDRFVSWASDPAPKRLRVGIVSGDFRDHSVGYFLEGVLKAIDAERIELLAYPTFPEESELTARIKPCFTHWTSLVGLADDAAARLIHADGVHVLLDLSGHTAHNRLPMFAWRPAPVQASWLGYCATTGVSEIDYYLADAWTLPEAQESYFSEQIWRLPDNYVCFSRPSVDLAVCEPPVLQSGRLTFGSFNNLAKMTEEVVELWTRILRAIPNSCLLLKASQLGDEGVCQQVAAQYSRFGIAPDRLLLEGATPGRAEHLSAYHRVDIGLDPFPYNGVTTTMEALWMGVPVLSLAGDRFLARQGVGILTNTGLLDWIAADADELLSKAVAFASDHKHLAELRAALRKRLANSPLLDAPRFARGFEDALWAMWRKFGQA